MRPRLLDLFSGAGGAARGYMDAGFHVTGVDIVAQPHYCGDEFVQWDALQFARYRADEYDAIHASPPCQAYVGLSTKDGRHPELIEPTRELLEEIGKPYVIENVVGAPLTNRVVLCGSMFGLGVRRHRQFETNWMIWNPPRCDHGPQGEIRAYYGKKGWAAWDPKGAQVQRADRKPLLRGSVALAPDDMGIDWMTWDELREAIPPAYAEWIGTQLLEALR